MREPIPGEDHHWFPKGLSKGWAGKDGKVTRTNHRGQVRRRFPKGLGYSPDGHNVLFEGGSPWDMTFEPVFDTADNAFPQLVSWLHDQADNHQGRVQGLSLGHPYRSLLAECLASLIVRSPRTRSQSERWTAQRQVEWIGFSKPHNVEVTAKGSLARLHVPFARAILTRGKIGILIAPKPSFLFGDGFLHNFHDSPDLPLSPTAMVALSPRVAILWFCPFQQPVRPEAVSLALTEQEIVKFNEVVQIYSRNEIFHVAERVELHESFRANDFHIAIQDGREHSAPILDQWMAEVLSVRWPG